MPALTSVPPPTNTAATRTTDFAVPANPAPLPILGGHLPVLDGVRATMEVQLGELRAQLDDAFNEMADACEHRAGERARAFQLGIEGGDRSLKLSLPERWLDSHPLTRTDLDQERDYLAAIDFKLGVRAL